MRNANLRTPWIWTRAGERKSVSATCKHQHIRILYFNFLLFSSDSLNSDDSAKMLWTTEYKISLTFSLETKSPKVVLRKFVEKNWTWIEHVLNTNSWQNILVFWKPKNRVSTMDIAVAESCCIILCKNLVFKWTVVHLKT